MTSRESKMYGELKARRRSLLQGYDNKDLHQLRITLRRIRSLLKLRPGGKARRLRRDLGMLAATTNPARDWDTLLIHARNTLSREQLDCLQPGLAESQAATHQTVLDMLRSKQWSVTTKAWKEYARDKNFGSNLPSGSRKDLVQAQHQVAKARHRALACDDEKNWHKLRIAVKELRYKLQNLPKRTRKPETVITLALCKRLQEDLGTWHDTVVHRQLLHEWLDGQKGDAESCVVNSLYQMIGQEGQECLDRIRIALEQQDIDFPG